MRFNKSMRKIREAAVRLTRRVAPLDLRRIEPVSQRFGCERGMPIDRRYIEAFLAANVERIRGRAMEIASADYIRKFGMGRVTQIEVLHATAGNPDATWVGDLGRPEDPAREPSRLLHLHPDPEFHLRLQGSDPGAASQPQARVAQRW